MAEALARLFQMCQLVILFTVAYALFLSALCPSAQATLVHVWRSEGVGSPFPLCGSRGTTVVGRLGTSTDPCQWPQILYFSTVQHSVHKSCVIAEHFKSGWFISVLDNANIFLFCSIK